MASRVSTVQARLWESPLTRTGFRFARPADALHQGEYERLRSQVMIARCHACDVPLAARKAVPVTIYDGLLPDEKPLNEYHVCPSCIEDGDWHYAPDTFWCDACNRQCHRDSMTFPPFVGDPTCRACAIEEILRGLSAGGDWWAACRDQSLVRLFGDTDTWPLDTLIHDRLIAKAGWVSHSDWYPIDTASERTTLRRALDLALAGSAEWTVSTNHGLVTIWRKGV